MTRCVAALYPGSFYLLIKLGCNHYNYRYGSSLAQFRMLSRLHNDVTGQDISEQENLACKWKGDWHFFEKVWFLENHENLSETKYSANLTSVTRSFLQQSDFVKLQPNSFLSGLRELEGESSVIAFFTHLEMNMACAEESRQD